MQLTFVEAEVRARCDANLAYETAITIRQQGHRAAEEADGEQEEHDQAPRCEWST